MQLQNQHMFNILHDAKVAWWAWSVRHPEYKDFRVGIVWPLIIQRYAYSYGNAWIVRIQRTSIHLLKA